MRGRFSIYRGVRCGTVMCYQFAGSLWTRSDLTALWRAHFHNFKHDDLSLSLAANVSSAVCAGNLLALCRVSVCRPRSRLPALELLLFSPVLVLSRRLEALSACEAPLPCASIMRITRAHHQSHHLSASRDAAPDPHTYARSPALPGLSEPPRGSKGLQRAPPAGAERTARSLIALAFCSTLCARPSAW